VKGQTVPVSGFFGFFRGVVPSAVGLRVRALPSCLDAGADSTWLHHTRLEARSPWRPCVQRGVSVVRCGLEIDLCPHPVLCKGMAERVPFASSVQARGRGSTRHPDTPIAVGRGARAGVQSTPRAQGARPRRSYAFTDAARPSSPRALRRLPPCAAREASGSSALRTRG
jgi:hypothetical protein